MDNQVIGSRADVNGMTATVPMKWFYTSRISEDVNEDTFRKNVQYSIDIADAIFVKPTSNKHYRSSNYLSYKVGVPDNAEVKTISSSS